MARFPEFVPSQWSSRAASIRQSGLRATIGRAWVFGLYFRGPRFMSALRKRWVLIRNPHVDIQFGPGTYLGPRFSLHAPYGGSFITGPGVEFRRDFRAELADKDASLVIGSQAVFTYSVLIQCGTSIDIGDRCAFGQSVMLVDGNHKFRDLDTPMLEQGYDFRPLVIGDDAVVLTKATVIASIGERAMVGANAVVTKPIPPRTVAAGVPARVIEEFGMQEAGGNPDHAEAGS